MSKFQDPVEMLAQEMHDRLAAASLEYERMKQRAEAAEAKLAAVPVDDIRKVWSAAPKNTATQSAILRVGDWLQARV